MVNYYTLAALATYYGMTVQEFIDLINGDGQKLARFLMDFMYNHN